MPIGSKTVKLRLLGPFYLTSGGELPRDGVTPEVPQRGGVDHGQEAEVEAHEEVGGSQVANQEP